MKALITGITGQDGSYLAEYLLKKGYQVHGIVRRESLENTKKLINIKHIQNELILHEGSLSDHLSIYKIFMKVLPNECYHLSASSFVNYTFNNEFDTMNINFNSTHYILSTIREVCSDCKLFFAGSSEMFGEPNISPQAENTSFNPKSIYGISKVASHYLLKNYRDREGVFACTGIMYNHESPRRGNHFVTKKIISTAVKIERDLENELLLGNLDSVRDWGYAPDYIRAMWRILQLDNPDDFIISTGGLHSVRDFLDIVFSYLDLDYKDYVKTDHRFYRESERIPLCGNPEKINKATGWTNKKGLESIIHEMVDAERSALDKLQYDNSTNNCDQ